MTLVSKNIKYIKLTTTVIYATSAVLTFLTHMPLQENMTEITNTNKK